MPIRAARGLARTRFNSFRIVPYLGLRRRQPDEYVPDIVRWQNCRASSELAAADVTGRAPMLPEADESKRPRAVVGPDRDPADAALLVPAGWGVLRRSMTGYRCACRVTYRQR